MEDSQMNIAGYPHTDDGAFPPDTPIGMAYVPVQKFQSIYEADAALDAGTVFAELNKPWLGSRAFAYGANANPNANANMPINAATPSPTNQALYNIMAQPKSGAADYGRGNEK